MHWVYTPYILPLLASAIISLALAIHIGQRRATPGALPFAVLMAAVTFWSAGNIFELGSLSLETKLVWANLEYLGIVIIPVAWFVFCLEYSGRGSWLTLPKLAALSIIPLVTFILAWTSPTQGLLRSDAVLILDAPFPYVGKTYGPWFWVHTAFSYSLLILGAAYLLQLTGRAASWYSGQIAVLMTGIALPWLANIFYITRLDPLPFLDPTPIAFSLSGVLVAWGTFRYRLMDIVPVARAMVIENMNDGVIILDKYNRIVDINPAAAIMVGKPVRQLIGTHADRSLSMYPELVEKYRNVIQAHSEAVIEKADNKIYLDISISPLRDGRRRQTGRVVVLRDVTDRRKAEVDLQESHAMVLATLEATADGILVVNDRGEIVRMNRKLAEMLHLPQEMLDNGHEKPKIDVLVEQLIHPDTFYVLMEKLNAFPEAESYDVLELKDGRVLERYSRPQRVGEHRVGRVWSFHDITEQRRAEEELRYLSSHDILTGLYNRGFFEEELNRLENSRLFPVSLIIADVDGLKAVNDTHGHASGDKLLRQAADILRSACRAEDVVARIGGDEFGILLPDSGPQVAENVIERIMNMQAIRRVGEAEVPLSLSLGAATAESGNVLRKVVRMADNAMYKVKRSKPGGRPGTGQLEL
jgi:diguanylate cyclase (GGDEF)-like protein/PAS domain S-box-containing protein